MITDFSYEGVKLYTDRHSIMGWQYPEDVMRLHYLSSISERDAVELGAFMGLSTIYMAAGIKFGNKNTKLVTVDHFLGSSEHKDLYTPEKIKDGFYFNIQRAGVEDAILVLEMDTIEAAKLYQDNSIGVLFIDASHEYEFVKKDFEAWYPKVIQNGNIILHDVGIPPSGQRRQGGPGKVYDEKISEGVIIPDISFNPTITSSAAYTVKP